MSKYDFVVFYAGMCSVSHFMQTMNDKEREKFLDNNPQCLISTEAPTYDEAMGKAMAIALCRGSVLDFILWNGPHNTMRIVECNW